MTFLCIDCGKNLDESNSYRKVKKNVKFVGKKTHMSVMRKVFTKNCLTIHIEREHENESKSSVLEKPIVDNVSFNNNNRTHVVGLGSSGKTHLMLKILSLLRNQDIYEITKSPPEQYSSSKIKVKELSAEVISERIR